MMTTQPVSCIVPNYNGLKLLPAFLDFLMRAVDPDTDEVIIVDDCSTDGSVEFIESHVSAARVIRMGRNAGFGEAVNTGMAVARNKLACVLNTDVEVEKNFLEPLREHFRRPDVFAVSGLEPGGTQWALPAVEFKFGIFYYSYYPISGPLQGAVPVLFAPGTCTLYDREKFLALKGFDPLFRPFYWEDMDLCLRAWKRGWSSFYEPRSRHAHKRQATIGGAYRQRFIQEIHWKNRFLFTWKNIKDPLFLMQHLVFLPAWLLFSPLLGKKEITIGFFRALAQFKEAWEARHAGAPVAIFSEREIVTRFRNGVWIPTPGSHNA
jgi:GT2 family glycosyltransferase